jgi:hypothetical protein
MNIFDQDKENRQKTMVKTEKHLVSFFPKQTNSASYPESIFLVMDDKIRKKKN